MSENDRESAEEIFEKVLGQKIRELNEKHAVVVVGGKTLILNEIINPIFKKPDISFSGFDDFHNRYANHLMTPPDDGKKISLSRLWVKSQKRREYDGIIFEPGNSSPRFYNLWKGFAAKPDKGDWKLMEDHIYRVICGGNRKWGDWLIAWMAHIVQNPGGNRPGVAIVMKGEKGIGKGFFVNEFGKLFGNHYLQISDSRHLTGKFNGHLKNIILLFCDEAFWAGDKSAEGNLKRLITENELVIEFKNKDAFSVKNNLSLIIASNEEWVVPAGIDERRFFVLEVSNAKQKDFEYFSNIRKQMDSGGREAMLYDLLNMDISGFNLRKPPRTPALFEQILKSMTLIQKFWFQCLKEETNSKNFGIGVWADWVSTDQLYTEFKDFCREVSGKNYMIKDEFAKQLRRAAPVVQERRGENRTYGYLFPDLGECREYFEKKLNIPDMDIWE